MIRPILAVALTFLVASASAEDEAVLVGTKDNFEEIISRDELILVKFYAPWCGHCKKMAGDFKEAAEELKGKATLVDLDATEEKDIAQKYGIRGFPTLKLFSKGEVISDYKGGRTKDALIKYIERASLPSVVECADADAVAAFAKDNKGKSQVYCAACDKMSAEYTKCSMSLRDSMPDSISFASVADAALLKELAGSDVAADSILLVREDGSSEKFDGKPEDLEDWVKLGSLPTFAELSRENAGVYTELNQPIFILFQDPEKKDKEVNEIVTSIASENRGAGVVFTWINKVELKSFAEHLGVADKTPAIVVYEFKSDTKFIFSEEFSKETVSAFVAKIIAGEMQPTTKSESIPEKNDEPVKIVVGESWKTLVEDDTKDVLIEQYAPWCGHCKKLAPILDDLATKLADVKTLVIAKMDATQNDAPKAFKAKGYPTLHFFPAGGKGVSYEGGRTLKDFVEYLKENATHKDGIELPAEEEKEEKEEAAEPESKEEL